MTDIIKVGNTIPTVNGSAIVASGGGLNPRSTSWDFASRTERLMYANQITYAFDCESSNEYDLYLPTDDNCFINGGRQPNKPKVRNQISPGWLCTLSDITQTGFTLTTGNGTGLIILIPYFLKSSQTFSITFTRSTYFGGSFTWCDIHGRFVSKQEIVHSGSGTTTDTFTATSNGWLYFAMGTYDANTSVTFSNISASIT